MTFQPNYHNNQLVASPNVMVGLYCHLNDRSTGLSSLSLVLGSMHVVTRNLLQVFFLALTGILKLLIIWTIMLSISVIIIIIIIIMELI